MDTLNIICLHEPAFYELMEAVVDRLQTRTDNTSAQKWISATEAMQLLDITSKTTLATYRNQGKIRYSQMGKKTILYDRESIGEYLEHHAKNTF